MVEGRRLNTNQNRLFAKRYTRQKLKEAGFGLEDWKALNSLIIKESQWNYEAQNPKSSAYGLFQILNMPPGTSIEKQVEKGIGYITKRYGTPVEAYKHHSEKGWY